MGLRMELLRENSVLVTPEIAVLGPRQFELAEIDSCYVTAHHEHAQRLGNILFVNLAIAAALYFLVPIEIGLWESKFYLGVGLFSLLALTVLDDVRRSNALVAYRLMLVRGEQAETAFVTADGRLARRIEHALRQALAVKRRS